VVQVLSNLNENFFDFVVKKFCGSSLAGISGQKVETVSYSEEQGKLPPPLKI
jgi:hypothetical protein